MGDLWDDATARRLALVLQGGYPPELVFITAAAGPNLITTCPSNVWRVVLFACGRPAAANQVLVLQIRRAGTYYTCAVGKAYTVGAAVSTNVSLARPIILMPNDSLYSRDIAAAGNVESTCGYVDVPIPHNDGLEARRIRRG